MQKVLTAEEMREVDRLTTEEFLIPSLLLMENAANTVSAAIAEKIVGSLVGKSVLVLCGKGNNGGDGAALARILWTQGAIVETVLFGNVDQTTGDARVNLECLTKIPISFTQTDAADDWAETFQNRTDSPDVLVDALWGTGLTRPVDSRFHKLLAALNSFQRSDRMLRVSVDIPSGLSSDSPEQIGPNFGADITVTFTAPKLANVFPPASNFNGEVIVAKIGSPPELIERSQSKLFVSEKSDAQAWLKMTEVRPGSYKKTRGSALIIAGSEKYSGAAVLSANSCFAAGAGLVNVAVPETIHAIVAEKTLDEVIVRTLDDSDLAVDVLAIGCGLAADESTHGFVREAVEKRKSPMVIDAEALNALAPLSMIGSDELPLVLTPHIGEFRRLLGREPKDDKIAEVREFSKKHNVILVLKGERPLIAKPDGTVVVNPTGNPGISRAGAGDTLTGIITAFIAQTMPVNSTDGESARPIDKVFDAVVAALYISGLAGDLAAQKFGQRLMTATDVRESLVDAIAELTKI